MAKSIILSCEYISDIEYVRNFFEKPEITSYVVYLKDGTESNLNAAMQIFSEKYYTEEVRFEYYFAGDVLSGYYGDVNADGEVTSSDARQILRYAVGLDNIAAYFDEIRSDVNKDGVVNAADARLALRMSVKLDSLEEIILS